MFVSAGLSLLYDIWPKPVRPVLFCLHLWDLHDLQQRRWHGFNGGLPTPGSLRRRRHDDTGGRTSPGWVEARRARSGRVEKKKVEGKKQLHVQKQGFSLVCSGHNSGSLIKGAYHPHTPTLSLALCFALWCVCVCVIVHPLLWLLSLPL